jgi:tetratricopeptide (TPR) repeat protein
MNIAKKYFLGALFFSFLFIAHSSFAQNETIRIKSKRAIYDSDTDSKLDGVQVIVFKNGAQEKVYDAGSSGKFDFSLPLGYSYDLKFSRADYVTKILRVDTRNIPAEDRAGGFQLDMEPSLFKYIDGFNTDILKEPMGKAAFDSQTSSITFDFDYTASMNKKIEDEFKRLADLAKNGDKQKKEFDKLIQEGDGKMTASKYEEAMSKYESALNIFPNDKPAKDKYDEAERKYKEFLANKNQDALYAQLIKDADNLYKNLDWENSKNKYNEALAIRSTENYPRNQIVEIDKKLLELENQKKYKAIIARADQEFNNENFETCINSYEEALQILSKDVYAQKQIDAAKAALLAIANDKSKQEEIERRYKALIASADDLFSKKQYLECIAKYKNASEIKPSEDYPLTQIDKANTALNASKPPITTPPVEDPNLAEFKRLISEADILFRESNLTNETKLKEARDKYARALALKSSERYPSRQIETIDQTIVSLNNSANNSDENWREKRLRQERELEEVRRKKEEELAENRADRLAEQLATESKIAEDARNEELKKNQRFQRDVDLNAEKTVEDFYRDAQKKAEKRKMLDITQAKAQDSTNQEAYRARQENAIKAASEEVTTTAEQLEELHRKPNEKLNENIDLIENAVTENNSRTEKNKELQNRRIDAQTEQINKSSEIALSISENDRLMTANVNKIEKEKEDRNKEIQETRKDEQNKIEYAQAKIESQSDLTHQYSEKANQQLNYSTQDVQAELDRRNNEEETARKSREAELLVAQSKIQKEIEKVDESLKKENDLLDKKRMELNAQAHAASLQELERKEKQEKAISSAIATIETPSAEPKNNSDEPEITEKSYETSQPSKKVIETTVKKGHKEVVYRKVVSKLGTYYYKGNTNITEDQWQLETYRK